MRLDREESAITRDDLYDGVLVQMRGEIAESSRAVFCISREFRVKPLKEPDAN